MTETVHRYATCRMQWPHRWRRGIVTHVTDDVAVQLMELAGGDPFGPVRARSEQHQADHGCGLHNAGAPVMQIVANIARAAGAVEIADLGCGLGYSTLWLALAGGPSATVVGIDSDPGHIAEAQTIASEVGLADRVRFETGRVVDVLLDLRRPFDLIHDDAWFARAPDHLDTASALLRRGGVLTMANWFLLVDALSGTPRSDWGAFAGPSWASDAIGYARQLAARHDLVVTWITKPPVGFAIKTTAVSPP